MLLTDSVNYKYLRGPHAHCRVLGVKQHSPDLWLFATFLQDIKYSGDSLKCISVPGEEHGIVEVQERSVRVGVSRVPGRSGV